MPPGLDMHPIMASHNFHQPVFPYHPHAALDSSLTSYMQPGPGYEFQHPQHWEFTAKWQDVKIPVDLYAPAQKLARVRLFRREISGNNLTIIAPQDLLKDSNPEAAIKAEPPIQASIAPSTTVSSLHITSQPRPLKYNLVTGLRWRNGS